jgi:nitrogenase molybdenum-iron protein alpha/beta subunit
MSVKVKYKDLPRFPKIQTNGFEKDFNLGYSKTLTSMIKNLATKMVEIVEEKNKKLK